MTAPVTPTRLLASARSRLSRRSVVALACLSPFTGVSARAGERITVAELWAAGGEFSPKAKRLAGEVVELRGYMAPPLKPEVEFFVLTALPMAVCPFCDSAAAWPEDIVLVYLGRPVRALPYDRLIGVSGTLQIGTETDAGTGFVSRVRLRQSKYAKI
jgi:hypothetical protein